MLVLCSNLVEVTELPEKHQQLLVELDLLGGVRQVRLGQRVGQQTSEALQDKVKVLQMDRQKVWFGKLYRTKKILKNFVRNDNQHTSSRWILDK